MIRAKVYIRYIYIMMNKHSIIWCMIWRRITEWKTKPWQIKFQSRKKVVFIRIFFLKKFFFDFEKVWEINCELLNGYKLAVNLMSRENLLWMSLCTILFIYYSISTTHTNERTNEHKQKMGSLKTNVHFNTYGIYLWITE